MPRSVFDIFLSSTSKDLAGCRAKVTEMIERMGQVAVRMETFGARPNKPLPVCRQEVEGCDALVVIVGHRYGWVPGEQEGGDGGKSITWWEVQWALDKGRPVYAFLLDPAVPWAGEREQDRLIEARTEAEFIAIGQAVARLLAFRRFLEQHTTRETFSSAEDLAGRVATSLHEWLLGEAIKAARAEHGAPAQTVHLPLPSGAQGEALNDYEDLYWQEQVHLLSARRQAGPAEGIKIALISGRANEAHPALAGASLRQLSVHGADQAPPPDDHTTALAALLAGDNPALPYHGIAAGSDLLVLSVLDTAMSTTNQAILAAVEAALVDGAQVICLPLGGVARSAADEAAFRRAVKRGAVIVCPAGNEARPEPVYPAGYRGCIAVAAASSENRLAFFSNFGDWVATAAPGVDIPCAVGDQGFQKWSGTSFACGIAAGVAALMLKMNPALTAAEIVRIFRTSGRPITAEATQTPAPEIRALDALQAVQHAREAPSATKRARRGVRPGARRKPAGSARRKQGG